MVEKKNSPVESSKDNFSVAPPSIAFPKGGGAIQGIGEKFAANPVTGTSSFAVPIFTSPGRANFSPQLELSYDSGSGNGIFGFGWNLPQSSITRKTDKGLPYYFDDKDSDTFVLSGAEDLVPVLGGKSSQSINGEVYTIRHYRPRIEGLFSRIERWVRGSDGDVHWRTLSKDNILTIYGRDSNSRIVNPENNQQIFSWFICEKRDDKGNGIIFEYKKDDGSNVNLEQIHQKNRGEKDSSLRSANCYLKRVFYGNKSSLLDSNNHRPLFLSENKLKRDQWFFETVFDYGEHDKNNPTSKEVNNWLHREDAFSNYRSGFEVRTSRLCQRVLMFHHFPDVAEIGNDYLVRSTNFYYSSKENYTFLESTHQIGYKKQSDDSYLSRQLPPLEFTYTQTVISSQLQSIEQSSIQNLPRGIDGETYRWVDLDGEGLSGILTEQADGWFYKRNHSPITTFRDDNHKPQTQARFASIEQVAKKPSLALASGGQFMDLSGNGQLDLVKFDGPTAGYFERTQNEDWELHKTFDSLPQLNWKNPNLKMIDITGDGHADILISEDEVFCWYPSLAEQGFAPSKTVRKALDDEAGPRIVFADGAQSISLADMSGDGLTDIVRIRNGNICYWPNLGYGRFGAKVTMDNAPWFDHSDQFNQQRIRLADIDGSGVIDIIYLGTDSIQIYFNHSGNAWSEVQTINHFPKVDNLANVQVVDLLGNGTACLVWSSALPHDAASPMKYIDLMGGQKPHLLIKTNNNLGAETAIQYAPSTQFYLRDKLAGNPWITKLPFPVHCVEKVTVTDKWRKTVFSSTYSYHHGYFDGKEREFRGFGRVEQVDTESYGEFLQENIDSPFISGDQILYQPPVKTITWFHTGAFLDRERILGQFSNEYFPVAFKAQNPGVTLTSFQEKQLPEPDLADADFSTDEWQEALRACKGMMLRQEVYELDGMALSNGKHQPVKLFSTAYHNCHIDKLQDKASNNHAVFLVTESEAITYNYELDLRQQSLTPDPRIAHTLNLNIDEFGNVLESVVAVYPRLLSEVNPDYDNPENQHILGRIHDVQAERHLVYTETLLTNSIGSAFNSANYQQDYRLAIPCQVQTFELTSITANVYYDREELKNYDLSQHYPKTGSRVDVNEIPYHQIATSNIPQKRCIEQVRNLFFDENLQQALAFQQQGRLALSYETYKLALTEALLDSIFANKLATTTQAYQDLNNESLSGYLSGNELTAKLTDIPAGQYWLRSGTAGFNADAPQHFYLPEKYTDAFGNVTQLEYDTDDLYIQSSADAKNNKVSVEAFDYRVLSPRKIKDINDNIAESYFDISGLPVAIASQSSTGEGDNLSGLSDALGNPTLEAFSAFFVDSPYSNSHTEQAHEWLQNASTRHLYYFGETIDSNGETIWGQYPACACSIARETHSSEPSPTAQRSELQIAFEYSDGSGNVLVQKNQAEPEENSDTLRWIANGKTILNNKGKPVKQYEPYFSASEDDSGNSIPDHRFEELQQVGVSPIMYYDAAGRLIRTDMPDGTFSRVEFTPWQAASYDANDTLVEGSQHWLSKMQAATASAVEHKAARDTIPHANTPSRVYLDTLGREVISIEHNKAKDAQGVYTKDEYSLTFTKLDAEGKPLWIRDARNNLVMQYINPPVANNEVNDPSDDFAPCYDIAGNLLFQHSMDAGDRWMIMDAAGKPFYAWDYNQWQADSGEIKENRIYHTTYDALHRPVTQQLKINNGDWQSIEYLVYGENQADDKTHSLRGQLYQHYDASGLIINNTFDFKGNLLTSQRQLTQDVTQAITDWSNPAGNNDQLSKEIFRQSAQYDALSRMVQQLNWHRDEGFAPLYQPNYNQRGLLKGEAITVGGNSVKTPRTTTEAIKHARYNAKGQRTQLVYGNGTETHYQYDEKNFRLAALKTIKTGSSGVSPYQDLSYTYDPIGNITHIKDKAQQDHYFSSSEVTPDCFYQYDALYRLIAATGRENAVQPAPLNAEYPFPNNDPNALNRYSEEYHYDVVGNILNVKHTKQTAASPAWKRCYQYANDSNRLLATGSQADSSLNCAEYYIDTSTTPSLSNKYHYDAHGSMLNTANVSQEHYLQWDYRDMVQHIELGGGGEAWYNYDSEKQRSRKVIKRNGGSFEERIYLGGMELYRKLDANKNITEEIETYHLFSDGQRLLLIDNIITTRNINGEALLYRYQYGNHLGSVALELNEDAAIISYEEYHPYGTAAYFSRNTAIRSEKKRYRYTGMEKDEESGLSYHSARYYLPWLWRWLSSDPLGIVDGTNLYRYSQNNPVKNLDRKGLQASAWDPDALAGEIDENIDYAQKQYEVENTGISSSLWNTFVATTADITKGSVNTLRIGKEASQGVDDIKRGLSEDGDGWDIAIGILRILSDGGEVASSSLGVAATTAKTLKKIKGSKVVSATPKVKSQEVGMKADTPKPKNNTPKPKKVGNTGEFILEGDGSYIYSDLGNNGVIDFAIEAGKGASIRGGELFKEMMSYYGSNVKGIAGNWTYGTNLAKVNELTANGMSLQEAISKTWTANQASKYGYTSARVTGVVGSLGKYEKVYAVFEKN